MERSWRDPSFDTVATRTKPISARGTVTYGSQGSDKTQTAAPFADAVGTSVEDFVKALPSADFRRVTDVRNRDVIFAALEERMPTLTARAALALITFAGGELARVVALVKDQLAAQVGG